MKMNIQSMAKQMNDVERTEVSCNDPMCDQVLQERDDAEDALSRMFQAATGRSAEWSSAWHYDDAIEEVEDYVAALQSELADAREANARLCALIIDSPRGLVEQVWTRKVSHEVTIDVMGAHLDMTGKTYRLVDEAAIATLQRDRQP